MHSIAIVRGHHLSKEETISYEPLRQEFGFTCFSTNNPWFDHSEIVFPIKQLRCTERLFRPLPFGLGNRIFGSIDNILGTGQWVFGLEKALHGFDLVHSSDYCHLFTYQIARAKKRLGCKFVVIHYDNIPFARDHKPIARATKYEVYDKADAFFAMSTRARESLTLEGVDPRKIFIIGNAVDTEKFRPRPDETAALRQRFGVKPDDLVILFLGRLHESKGIYELMYAAAKLLSDPDIDTQRLRILVAGRGKRRRALELLVRRLGIQGHIWFIGGIPHAQVHLLHAAVDIFALPSIATRYWQEQFGIVLAESMACGKPIVTTLSGSIPDVVADAALLVQPNDHYALYTGLKSLVVDPRLRDEIGARARERALAEYSMSTIAGKLRNAYSTVLGKR
jgi:starch synthase